MRTALLVFAVGLLAAQLQAETLKQRMQNQGLGIAEKPIPPVDFELQDLSGRKVKLSALKGKVVFLNFWATWCGPCRSEMPSMQRLYEKLKADGLEILAVDLQEDKGKVQAFAKELGLRFPILLDSDGRVGGAFNTRSIPTTYLVGRDGVIFARAVGSREWDTPELIDIFRLILKEGLEL